MGAMVFAGDVILLQSEFQSFIRKYYQMNLSITITKACRY